MAKRTPPRARDAARASSAPEQTVATSVPDNAAGAPAATDGKAWRRINFTPEAIADIRERYEETPESVASIARDYEVDRVTIERLARRHNWSKCRRRPLDVPAAIRLRRRAEALAAANTFLPPPESGRVGVEVIEESALDAVTPTRRASRGDLPLAGGGTEERAAPTGAGAPGDDAGETVPQMIATSVDAMLREAQAQLAQVTARREARRGRQTYTESNTATRTLSHLIATIKELESMQQAPAGTAISPSGADDDDDMPRDIDEFRRALARRIDEFVRSRTEPDDAGGGGEDSASRVDEV